jgi:hypothetical protein
MDERQEDDRWLQHGRGSLVTCKMFLELSAANSRAHLAAMPVQRFRNHADATMNLSPEQQ